MLEVLENFVVFATAFALAGFAIACAARASAVAGRTVCRLARSRACTRWRSSCRQSPPAGSWPRRCCRAGGWVSPASPRRIRRRSTASIWSATSRPGWSHCSASTVVLMVVGRGAARGLVDSARSPPARVGGGAARARRRSAACGATRAGRGTPRRRHGLDVGLVQSDYPFSFVWGFRRSKLVISSGLLAALTPDELAGVLEHEAAHHARRDNLVKLALVIAAHASLAAPLGRRLLRWRNEQVELLCDEIAAARGSAPLDIAEALVKLRRRTQALGARPALAAAASRFVPDDDRSVERRVRRLVALADMAAPPGVSTVAAPRAGPHGRRALPRQPRRARGLGAARRPRRDGIPPSNAEVTPRDGPPAIRLGPQRLPAVVGGSSCSRASRSPSPRGAAAPRPPESAGEPETLVAHGVHGAHRELLRVRAADAGQAEPVPDPSHRPLRRLAGGEGRGDADRARRRRRARTRSRRPRSAA